MCDHSAHVDMFADSCRRALLQISLHYRNCPRYIRTLYRWSRKTAVYQLCLHLPLYLINLLLSQCIKAGNKILLLHFSRQIYHVKLSLRIIDGYKKPVVMCMGHKVKPAARWQHFISSLPANVYPVIRHKSSLISWINPLFELTIDKRYVRAYVPPCVILYLGDCETFNADYMAVVRFFPCFRGGFRGADISQGITAYEIPCEVHIVIMVAPLWRLKCQTKSDCIQAIVQELIKWIFYIYTNRYPHIRIFVPKSWFNFYNRPYEW